MPCLAPALALLLASGDIPAIAPIGGAPAASDVEVIKTRTDQDRRMTVPVRIGEAGPFHFVIDTGSQTTVVSTDLALRLALAPGRKARVIGVGGSESVDTAIVDRLELGRRTHHGLTVALLEAQNIGADGIVGIDSLQHQRLMLDFARNLLSIGDLKTSGGNRGFEIVVTARRRQGQLIMTNAMIDGIRVDVVIDTGADTSIGNRALQRVMKQRGIAEQAVLIGVTGQRVIADLGYPRKLEIGEIGITNLIVAYADSPIFTVLDLERKPAMMLGMRELRLFKRVAIDFAARKIYFDIPEGG